MARLPKGFRPDNFESYSSLQCSFTTTRFLCCNFLGWESFLEANPPDILALYKTNLKYSIDSSNFPMKGYLPLIRKPCSLCKGETSFCTVLIPRKLWVFVLLTWNLKKMKKA